MRWNGKVENHEWVSLRGLADTPVDFMQDLLTGEDAEVEQEMRWNGKVEDHEWVSLRGLAGIPVDFMQDLLTENNKDTKI